MRFGARGLGAAVLLAPLLDSPAGAQQADAGVEHRAGTSQTAPRSPAEASGTFPKSINPAQLSEGVRASLQERAAARHAASLPSLEAEPSHPLGAPPAPPLADAVGAPGARHRLGTDEPLRRGLAHMRRMQALETDEGVTVLSNRIVTPEPRAAALVARAPARPLHDAPAEPEAVAVNDRARVTETRSLRPASARQLDAQSSGLGWLAWPLVLFVTTGAVLGTLWFRRKTD